MGKGSERTSCKERKRVLNPFRVASCKERNKEPRVHYRRYSSLFFSVALYFLLSQN